MSKLIVITGATRGLGLALAQNFAAGGHTVIGCGRNANAIAVLNEQFGDPHLFQAVDVADDQQVAQFAAHVLESYGAPDLLINNAALMNSPKPLWEIPAVEFDSLMAVNISGTANLIRHFLLAMGARRKGVIVNFSSGWGRSTDANVAPYCASKWAIEGLTQSLSQELPPGLATVTLNPGIIDTDMLRTCWPDGASSFPNPAEWVKKAAPFILKLGAKDNGKALTVS